MVLCHTDPDGVLRLIKRMRALSPTSFTVVRYEDETYLDPEQVRDIGALPFVSTQPVAWGDWSSAAMVLEALEAAQRRTGADYYVVISGQDYPIRDLTTWEAEVAASGSDALLAPAVGTADDHHYRRRIINPRGTMPRPFGRVARHLVWRIGTTTRALVQICPGPRAGDPRWWIGVRRPTSKRAPHEMALVKSSQWMTLSSKALTNLVRRHHEQPELEEYFRGVRVPDEYYASSVLHDDSDILLTAGHTSAAWFTPVTSSPAWLDEAVLRRAASTGAPFARKVPTDVTPRPARRRRRDGLRLNKTLAACRHVDRLPAFLPLRRQPRPRCRSRTSRG